MFHLLVVLTLQHERYVDYHVFRLRAEHGIKRLADPTAAHVHYYLPPYGGCGAGLLLVYNEGQGCYCMISNRERAEGNLII